MPAQKRPLDKPSSTKKAKKFRTNDTTKSLPTEEVDFPRGGGTTFTPLEVKAIRAEAVKEANAELFEVSQFFLLSKRYGVEQFLVRIFNKVLRRAKRENAKLKPKLLIRQKEKIG